MEAKRINATDAGRPVSSEHSLGQGEYRLTPSSSTSFVANHVDFRCPDADVRRKTEGTRRVQWIVDIQRKAHEVYMQAAHSHTQLAKSRTRRLPIDGDEDELGDEATNVGDLLDQLAACMVSDRGQGQGMDWRQPGQLEAFLGKCLESWQAHGAILEIHAQLQEHLQDSLRAIGCLKRHLKQTEEDNELLRWYAVQLRDGAGTSGLTTPVSLASSSTTANILQEAREAAARAAAIQAADVAETAQVLFLMGKKWRYGVIIDAGSSGSRVHVYRWIDHLRATKDATTDELHSLPKIKTKWTKKIRPGISTFGDKASTVGADHLKGLIDYALDVVPAEMVADTPIFLMATAGMRFLPQQQQNAVLRESCAYLRQNTQFSLPDCTQNIQVISGETEGLFGWIAANYLLGGFDHPEQHAHGQDHHTYGFLDMGGASAQIAFAPNSTEAAQHADDLKLVRLRTLDGRLAEHRVFTATWLGFGVNKARESYVAELVRQSSSAEGDISDPCMPKGLQTTLEGPTLVGAGDFAGCLTATKPLLAQDKTCGDGSHPCLIHDSVPSIDFNVNHFIGVSEYYHSTHGFFGEKGDQAYDFSTYQHNVLEFCDQDWSQIQTDIEEKQKQKQSDTTRTLQDAQQACFKASWVINVLHEGIGIPRVGLEKLPGINVSHEALEGAKEQGFATPFRPVDKIDSVEVSWTLGRMLLYAAGQVQPYKGDGKEDLAVGFGSNVQDDSTPADFSYAGSTWERPQAGGSLADTTQKRSVSPGLVVFVLVVAVVVSLLRKKEKRTRLSSWFGSWTRRPRGPGGRLLSSLAGKLFGQRQSRDYERVLEEGGMEQLELGELEADESEISDGSDGSGPGSGRSQLARTSGLATPRIGVDGFEDVRMFSGLDRSGLVVRTESRERLVPKSRAGSPTRLKSPMMAALHED
ncbi:nucleoside diphosphatase [Grosmannia clavigera kw1407]|uniref:Nucleoside diphosphatase n=1 Tax=Grosmannia clavigera (strain kw1407 / UAMH 11150) TaxID=655863 RepID=F0XFD7_GROCL|nr:nucleoside diphosphatase [Grosmannia clavigera kw1407]EFX04595.1 nucleoside diphosphatase [Grosmannia clavigera kw1407]